MRVQIRPIIGKDGIQYQVIQKRGFFKSDKTLAVHGIMAGHEREDMYTFEHIKDSCYVPIHFDHISRILSVMKRLYGEKVVYEDVYL